MALAPWPACPASTAPEDRRSDSRPDPALDGAARGSAVVALERGEQRYEERRRVSAARRSSMHACSPCLAKWESPSSIPVTISTWSPRLRMLVLSAKNRRSEMALRALARAATLTMNTASAVRGRGPRARARRTRGGCAGGGAPPAPRRPNPRSQRLDELMDSGRERARIRDAPAALVDVPPHGEQTMTKQWPSCRTPPPSSASELARGRSALVDRPPRAVVEHARPPSVALLARLERRCRRRRARGRRAAPRRGSARARRPRGGRRSSS